jgi:hypothetical protein
MLTCKLCGAAFTFTHESGKVALSKRETIVPLPRPVLERKLNGQGLHGNRARRAAGTGSSEHPKQ